MSKQIHSNSGRATLGPLEAQVMQILWKCGQGSVREVKQRLPGQSAYTTVMTTLVRLYSKGLLQRREHGRGFIYSPRVSAEQWARMAAADCIRRLLDTPNFSRELLLSCLVETLLQYDGTLLTETERKMFGMGCMVSAPSPPH